MLKIISTEEAEISDKCITISLEHSQTFRSGPTMPNKRKTTGAKQQQQRRKSAGEYPLGRFDIYPPATNKWAQPGVGFWPNCANSQRSAPPTLLL